ncbi:hypothetical protein BDM02DRAFT_3188461 [Thelephora ganbajun]|uniref:Uncharacterized protein n=1 Tax=Thelephora ganbajun TaxID=370292 RepID=A0ACB6ZBF3_THEGA|nr:hypothetical protein BDM02DRAFT_3188461 [Thelephora ganbajun]
MMLEVHKTAYASCSHNVHTFIFHHTLFQAPDLDPMAVWDLACTWQRSLVFLARGLCACSLAILYLIINLVLCSGHRTARTAQPSHPQESLGEKYTGSSPSSTAEEKSSVISETPLVGFESSFSAHCHPRFAKGQPLTLNPQESVHSLVIPKIVVQDFSAKDGLVRYKTPEYDLAHTLKRRRRLSWARVSVAFEDHLAVNT